MSQAVPVIYLLHGEDDFGIAEFIRSMLSKMGDPSMAEMNTTRLGAGADLESIRAAASAVPFLAPRRVVIVEDAAGKYKSAEGQGKFIALLESLPQTTALVLVEPKSLSDKNWLLKWAQRAADRAYIRSYAVPQGAQMADWIRKYAAEQGGEISFQAASLLAESAQDAPRMAVLEVEKLLAYVNYQRPVDVDDVEAAAAFTSGQGDYFAFLDAIAARNGRRAMDMLEKLLDERDAIGLFFSLVGHFRLVLQAREIYENGGQADTVAQVLKIHPFRARKMVEQARTLPLPVLESMYLRLQQLDFEIKTGQVQPQLALETMVAELSTRSN